MAKVVYVDGSKSLEEDGTVHFAYTNYDGDEEYIEVDDKDSMFVTYWDVSNNKEMPIYTSDIPNLILALQAAYDYINKEK